MYLRDLTGADFYCILSNAKTVAMTIYLPGAMFAAGISLYLFHNYNRTKQAKQDERRESLHEIRQQYLQQMIEVKKRRA